MGDLYDHLGQRCRCGHTVHSHSHGSGRCESCPCLRFDRPPKRKTAPRPTVQVMDGETGEDECLPFDDLYPVRKSALDTTPCHYDWYDAMRGGPCSCPAPTPRVP